MTTTPPRLLAGATLLFWGGLTHHPLIGLIAAILVESKSWISTRWELSDRSYVRSWHLSILSGALVAMLAWLNGLKPGEFHTLFIWVPLFLLPLELAQRYGSSHKIPLNTFSFFARKKWQLDLSMGREVSNYTINTGYPYIAITILATSMGSRHGLHHFIGLSIIVAACLFSTLRKSGVRPWAWSFTIITCLTIAFIGQWAVRTSIDQYGHKDQDYSGRNTSANESRTNIGKLGKLKLSSKVFWRMKVTEANVPDLLTTAVYNTYNRAVWRHNYDRTEISKDSLFLGAQNIESHNGYTSHLFGDSKNNSLDNDQSIKITGAINTKLRENPIPVPHYSSTISVAGKKTGIEASELGTVRIHNPEHHILEYSVWSSSKSSIETQPNSEYDLDIPDEELESIRRVNQSLGLNNPSLTTAKKIQILRQHFNSEFTYTTHLKTPRLFPPTRSSAIGIFLENTKSGHCEYFATATTLLLREQGIPTRYCVGFAIKDKPTSSDEWLIRGTAAHAWCRVWIDDHWENLDLTPSSWQSIESINEAEWQRELSDWWHLTSEDFFLWRTNSNNKSKVFNIIVGIIILSLTWIIWRLWKSRKTQKKNNDTSYQRPLHSNLTDLNGIEDLAAQKIGFRPHGTPLCEWITGISQLESSLAKPLNRAITLHSVIRFDPDGGSAQQKEELSLIVRKLRPKIKALTKPVTPSSEPDSGDASQHDH